MRTPEPPERARPTAGTHHSPRYHVRPPTGYVNDPNGPVWHGDRYHLYFQYVADTPREGPVHWGHATSTDLVSWDLHPDALVPTPGTPDADGCWSGNTVSNGETLYAFYSAFDPQSRFQPVRVAVSTDGGFCFTDSRAIVDEPAAAERPVQFRDPFVWPWGERWRMVVGAGVEPDLAQARLYESDDLTTWRPAGIFASLPRTGQGTPQDTGMMWECPQFAPFGDRGALLIGSFGMDGTGTMTVLALVGADRGDRLEDFVIDFVDDGNAFYAPSVLPGSDRNLLWGWVTETRSREWTIEEDWSGCLTLPRELRLDGDRLGSYAPAELDRLRTDVLLRSTPGSAAAVDGVPAQCEIEIRCSRLEGPAAVRVNLGTHEGTDEHLDLTVDPAAGTVTVDTRAASADPRATGGTWSAEVPDLGSDRPVRLRWFLDGSVGELFTGTGHVLTHRFYPVAAPPWQVQADADPGITVWSLHQDAVHPAG